METKTFLDWVLQYGLGNVLSLAVAFAFWRVLIFVLNENSKREDRLAGIIENYLGKFNSSIEQIIKCNSLQREEHNKMIEALDKILISTRSIVCVKGEDNV